MTIRRAMILAAGRGTRLAPMTDRMPKPLIRVGEMCPLIRTLYLLAQAGVTEVAINTHRFADAIRQEVAEHAPEGVDIHFFHEERLLETGGGIKNALAFLSDEPFLVVNGDVIWLEEAYPLLTRLVHAFNPAEHDALLSLVPLSMVRPARSGNGDFLFDEHNHLQRPRDGERAPYVYACVQVMHGNLLSGMNQDAFPLLPCFERAARAGRLGGMVYNGPWVDIGTPEGLAVARTLLTEQTTLLAS